MKEIKIDVKEKGILCHYAILCDKDGGISHRKITSRRLSDVEFAIHGNTDEIAFYDKIRFYTKVAGKNVCFESNAINKSSAIQKKDFGKIIAQEEMQDNAIWQRSQKAQINDLKAIKVPLAEHDTLQRSLCAVTRIKLRAIQDARAKGYLKGQTELGKGGFPIY